MLQQTTVNTVLKKFKEFITLYPSFKKLSTINEGKILQIWSGLGYYARAKNLFNLINKYSLLNVVTQSNLMCISEKVLLVLKQIKWKKVFVFSPGEEEFLLDKIR